MQRKQQNFRVRQNIANDARGFEAVQAGHGNIHDDELGPQRFRKPDGFLTISGFAAKLPLWKSMKDFLNASTDNRVVIDDDYSWHGPSLEI
jgi:hypothetical protein